MSDIEQRWVVGTAASCDVRVKDEYASLKHCEVARLRDGRFAVRDLGSTNGTRIRSHVRNVVGELRPIDTKVYDWMIIEPGQSLVVGRSEISWEMQR